MARIVRQGAHMLRAMAVSFVLASAANAATPLTLPEALARAERDNPELAALRAGQESRSQQAAAAARATRPVLSLSLDAFRTDDPVRVFGAKLGRSRFGADDLALDRLNAPGALTHVSSALRLQAPLDLSGAMAAAADASAAAARADAAEVDEAVQDLRLAVTQAYWRATLAGAAVEATRHALESARSREAELQSRVEVGGALTADLLRARTRRRQREAELAERENDRAAALALLARLMGAPAASSELADGGPADAAAPAGEIDDWMARAVRARTGLRAAAERTAAAGAAARGEMRTSWPGLALYGQVQDDRGSLTAGGGQWFAAGVSVQWTPFDAARSRRQAAARAGEQAARSAQRAAEEQVRLEVTVAWRTARTAAYRRAAAAGGTEEAREALRVIRERRQAGMATLTDELDTESALLAAELEELRASTEAALAAAALRRAAGELQ